MLTEGIELHRTSHVVRQLMKGRSWVDSKRDETLFVELLLSMSVEASQRAVAVSPIPFIHSTESNVWFCDSRKNYTASVFRAHWVTGQRP